VFPRALRGEHDASVKSVAERFGIPYRTIDSVRGDEFEAWVRSFDPDVVLSANSLIFPESLLAVPRIATINRHTGLLPSYGGLLPVFRAIQRGERWVGASVHVMTPEIDGGPVIARKWIPVEPGDSLDSLYEVGFTLSVDATEEAFALLRAHGRDVPPLPDDGLTKSYFSFPKPEDWREFRARGGRFI
jgi:methionyl-tRNA formyltransferase